MDFVRDRRASQVALNYPVVRVIAILRRGNLEPVYCTITSLGLEFILNTDSLNSEYLNVTSYLIIHRPVL